MLRWLREDYISILVGVIGIVGALASLAAGQGLGAAILVGGSVLIIALRLRRGLEVQAQQDARSAKSKLEVQMGVGRFLGMAVRISVFGPPQKHGYRTPVNAFDIALWLQNGAGGFYTMQEVQGWQSMRDAIAGALVDLQQVVAIHGSHLSDTDRARVDEVRRGAEMARDASDRILRQYISLEKTFEESRRSRYPGGSQLPTMAFEMVTENIQGPSSQVALGWKRMVLASADLLGAGVSLTDREKLDDLRDGRLLPR